MNILQGVLVSSRWQGCRRACLAKEGEGPPWPGLQNGRLTRVLASSPGTQHVALPAQHGETRECRSSGSFPTANSTITFLKQTSKQASKQQTNPHPHQGKKKRPRQTMGSFFHNAPTNQYNQVCQLGCLPPGLCLADCLLWRATAADSMNGCCHTHTPPGGRGEATTCPAPTAPAPSAAATARKATAIRDLPHPPDDFPPPGQKAANHTMCNQ